MTASFIPWNFALSQGWSPCVDFFFFYTFLFTPIVDNPRARGRTSLVSLIVTPTLLFFLPLESSLSLPPWTPIHFHIGMSVEQFIIHWDAAFPARISGTLFMHYPTTIFLPLSLFRSMTINDTWGSRIQGWGLCTRLDRDTCKKGYSPGWPCSIRHVEIHVRGMKVDFCCSSSPFFSTILPIRSTLQLQAPHSVFPRLTLLSLTFFID